MLPYTSLTANSCPASSGKSVKFPSSSLAKNISLYPNIDSHAWSLPSRSHMRGASRSSRTLGAGCDGRFGSLDERAEADGEIAWSWPPDAEVKLTDDDSAGDGG